MRLTKGKKELTPSQAPCGALRMEWAEVGERPDLCVPPSAESHRHERMERLTDGGGRLMLQAGAGYTRCRR